jgi:hypothetical protein
VTPFSPRALDRALAAVSVALGRLGLPSFTPALGASQAATQRGMLDMAADVIAARAADHKPHKSAADQQQLRDHVRQRVTHALDDWAKVAMEVANAGGKLGYQKDTGVSSHLLREMLDREPMPPHRRRFRAPRSLRDVEAAVLVKVETPTGQLLEE